MSRKPSHLQGERKLVGGRESGMSLWTEPDEKLGEVYPDAMMPMGRESRGEKTPVGLRDWIWGRAELLWANGNVAGLMLFPLWCGLGEKEDFLICKWDLFVQIFPNCPPVLRSVEEPESSRLPMCWCFQLTFTFSPQQLPLQVTTTGEHLV